MEPHKSKPWNPLIAQTFYRRGLIESWGRGTLKIRDALKTAGLAPPEYNCHLDEVIIRFRNKHFETTNKPLSGLESRLESGKGEARVGLESVETSILNILTTKQPLSRTNIAKQLGHKKISGAINRAIRKLLSSEKIKYTIPEKPNSRLQRYQLVM